MPKKPRNIKNKSCTLKCNENSKGIRTIDIAIKNQAMHPKQAKTIHSTLLQMIVWCESLIK